MPHYIANCIISATYTEKQIMDERIVEGSRGSLETLFEDYEVGQDLLRSMQAVQIHVDKGVTGEFMANLAGFPKRAYILKLVKEVQAGAALKVGPHPYTPGEVEEAISHRWETEGARYFGDDWLGVLRRLVELFSVQAAGCDPADPGVAESVTTWLMSRFEMANRKRRQMEQAEKDKSERVPSLAAALRVLLHVFQKKFEEYRALLPKDYQPVHLELVEKLNRLNDELEVLQGPVLQGQDIVTMEHRPAGIVVVEKDGYPADGPERPPTPKELEDAYPEEETVDEKEMPEDPGDYSEPSDNEDEVNAADTTEADKAAEDKGEVPF